MAKIVIQNEEGQNLNRYKMTQVAGQETVFDLERMATITKQGTPYSEDTLGHYVQNEDVAALSTAVQSATVGGAAVPKSSTTLQLPAYPVIPTALKSPYALTVSVGNGGSALAYDGSAAQSISIPKLTLSTTATPAYTLATGELYLSST